MIKDVKRESDINQYVKDDMNSKPKGFNDSDCIGGVPFYHKDAQREYNRIASEVADNCYSGLNIKDPQKILNTSAVSVSSAIDGVDAAITTLTSMGYTFHGGTHWEPMLGVKPVFTKEMADAGESPPVGSSVLVNGIKGEVMLGKDGHGVIVVKSNGFWVNAYVREIFPIPTERDLITSDLQDIIASQGHLNKANITDQIANLIYDAGYRKSDKGINMNKDWIIKARLKRKRIKSSRKRLAAKVASNDDRRGDILRVYKDTLKRCQDLETQLMVANHKILIYDIKDCSE